MQSLRGSQSSINGKQGKVQWIAKRKRQVFHMEYYAGNGIYEYLDSCENGKHFFRPARGIWFLVYGNRFYEPVVLTIASANRLGAELTSKERGAMYAARQVAAVGGLPVNFIRFDADHSVEQVRYWEPEMHEISVISSAALKRRFCRFGLEMNERTARKAINDKSASPYHIWQRSHMGDTVTVADIDLLRYTDKKPAEIIELKRSYIKLEKWQPYRQDYKNFILLSKLAVMSGLAFYIVYNRRIKVPFYDDIARLKLFAFDHRARPACRFLGYWTMEQFAENKAEKENGDGEK